MSYGFTDFNQALYDCMQSNITAGQSNITAGKTKQLTVVNSARK